MTYARFPGRSPRLDALTSSLDALAHCDTSASRPREVSLSTFRTDCSVTKTANPFRLSRSNRRSVSELAEISGQYPGSCLVRSYIFFQLYFSLGGGTPLPAVILAGRSQKRNPCEVRSSLSQFPLRRASLPPTGQKTATRSSYAAVQFVNGIRSLVTDGAASRRTTNITTGFGSIAAAAPIAEQLLPSFRCFLFRTRISVW